MLELTQALAKNLYRRNRSRIRGRLGKDPDEGPRMRPQEEDIVREILVKLQPSRCLEWGGVPAAGGTRPSIMKSVDSGSWPRTETVDASALV
jgi:hypothetical protein